jgi:hypothetical protein
MRFRLGLRLPTRPSSRGLGRLPQPRRGKGPQPSSPLHQAHPIARVERQSVPDVRTFGPRRSANRSVRIRGLPTEALWPSPFFSRPGRVARARDKISPSLIAYQAILHSKQSGYWLDESFLSVRPAAFGYFYPLPLKEIQPYSIKRLVFRKTCRSCPK